MSHTPPVPPGNQSPFPRAEPPHQHHDDDAVRSPGAGAPATHDSHSRSSGAVTVAVLAGVAAVAALAGAFIWRGDAKAKRKTPPRKPAAAGKATKRRAKAS